MKKEKYLKENHAIYIRGFNSHRMKTNYKMKQTIVFCCYMYVAYWFKNQSHYWTDPRNFKGPYPFVMPNLLSSLLYVKK